MGIKNIACLGETEGCHLLKFILPNQAKNNEIWKSLLYQIRNDKSSFYRENYVTVKIQLDFKNFLKDNIKHSTGGKHSTALHLSNLILRESQKFTKIESLNSGTEI